MKNFTDSEEYIFALVIVCEDGKIELLLPKLDLESAKDVGEMMFEQYKYLKSLDVEGKLKHLQEKKEILDNFFEDLPTDFMSDVLTKEEIKEVEKKAKARKEEKVKLEELESLDFPLGIFNEKRQDFIHFFDESYEQMATKSFLEEVKKNLKINKNE